MGMPQKSTSQPLQAVEPVSEVAILSVSPQMFQVLSHPHILLAKKHNVARTMHVSQQCLRIRQPSGVALLATSQTALLPWVCAPSKAESVVVSTELSLSAVSKPAIPRTSTYRWGSVRPAPLRQRQSAAFQSSNPSQTSLVSIFRSSNMMMMTLMQLLPLSKLNRLAYQ